MGAWVNSAQSLQPLPAVVCVVVFGLGQCAACSMTCGCMGKFHTIIVAIAGFCLCCCIWFGAMVQRDFVGVWVNSTKSLRLLLAFVYVVFGVGAA